MRTQSRCWGLAESPLSATESPRIRLLLSMEQRMETGPIAKPEMHISVQILCCGFAICNLRTHRGLKGQNRTGGSNPSPSAMQSGPQRRSAAPKPKYAKHARISRYSSKNRTGENGVLGVEWRRRPGFLRRAQAQSGFEEGMRRMQCDHSARMRPERVDF